VLQRGWDLGESEDGEVPGDTVVPAEVDDAAATAAREAVEAKDHLPHPVRLAGDVAVVGAILCAGGHQHGAMEHEWAGGGYDHLGLLDHGLERIVVGRVCDEQRQVLQLRAKLLAYLFQSVSATTSDAPLQCLAVIFGYVLAGNFPRETCGSINDQIKLARGSFGGQH
jgi:hypothetical protein